MDCLVEHLAQSNQVWSPYKTRLRLTLDVTEALQRHDSHVGGIEQIVTHRVVAQNEVGTWLRASQRVTPGTTATGQHPDHLLRMVWVAYDRLGQAYDISADVLEEALDAFKLKQAFSHSRTAFAGIAELPTDMTRAGTRTFAFCIHPKLTLVWSSQSTTNCTQAVCFASLDHISQMKKILATKWGFMNNALFPAFFCALQLGSEIDIDQNKIKHKIREVEVRTGFHQWAETTERPATEDLSELSAKMSGHATKMASMARKIRVVEELHKAILEGALSVTTESSSSLVSAVGLLSNRCRMQTVDTEFIQHRISVQLVALNHLISQNDVLLSQSMAHDSRLLAISSQRDSSSMKTLAVVTMFFLPGTFVASLFAMPFFVVDSEASRVVLQPNFYLYWAVALPLTVVTLLVWLGWSIWRDRRDRIEVKREQSKLVKEMLSMPISIDTKEKKDIGWSMGAMSPDPPEIQTLVTRKSLLERQATMP